MPLRTDYTNDTVSQDTHPGAHNLTNTEVNTLDTRVGALEPAGNIDTRLAAIESRFAAVDLAQGVATLDRANIAANTALVGSRLQFGYIVPPATFTCTKIRTYSGTTAAGATPTLVQLAVYREETNGDLTLLGQTANTTSIYSLPNTVYEPALQTAVPLTAGHRYALAILIVSAAAMPNTPTTANLGSAMRELFVAPRRASWRAGATLTTPVLVADLAFNWIPYLVALP